MKTLLFSLAVLASPCLAETLTQGERDRLMSEMHATRKRFLDSIAGLSEKQWNFKPDEKTWSVAECAEHITLSENFIFDLVTQKLMQTPAAPEKKDLAKGKDEFMMTAIRDRSAKFQAPEPLKPSTRQWPTIDAVSKEFRARRDAHIAYVQTTQDDLRNHFLDHPVAKTADGYQWLIMVSAHSDRHVAQILELKARPDFPK
jgi:uncharacterized damage-inducible protein DinB